MRRTDSALGYQSEEDNIVAKLRADIDALHLYTKRIKDSILDLARYLDENKIFERNQICRKIKEKLQDKIKEGKITDKWIEASLPPEYKRRYTKSELSSVSNENKQEQVLSVINNRGAKSITEIEFNAGDSKAIAKNDTNGLSQEDIKKYAGILERSLDAIDISKNPLEFSIRRDKYQNLITAMQDSDNAIYAIFKDGKFQYAYPDKAQI